MIVKCLYNTGESLRNFEYSPITDKNVFGRFGVSGSSDFNEIKVGVEYLVMGIIVFETYQAYLIDDNGFISACPCQLFEVVDDRVNSNWHFRLVEKDEESQRIYFRRKIELEKQLMILNLLTHNESNL